MQKSITFSLLSLLFILISACKADIPKEAKELNEASIPIYPDYSNITIPENIAPLNFTITTPGDEFITRYSTSSKEIIVEGANPHIPLKKWRRLFDGSGSISVDIYIKNRGVWNHYPTFIWSIKDEIDSYIAYRIIPPSVESYEEISIMQRNISTFEERVIYTNRLVQDNKNGQCINCHHFKNYQADRMLFHARQYLGGTILINQHQVSKIDLKTDSTISAGVYPAWHPTHNYIAFSTNRTKQSLHTNNTDKVEVFDIESDLILYNIDENDVSIIENDALELECFPAWSPDGKYLYYVSAYVNFPANLNREEYIMKNYTSVHYNLYRKPFNPEDATWGKKELVIDAAKENKSITLPRVSPDGKQLMFTMGNYGVFHIWHSDADLYLLNIEDGTYRNISEINSDNVESYHSWSSNGRWIIFSSRRDDGNYTRLYLSHYNNDGTLSKPFILPQKSPHFYNCFNYSYNIPEFTMNSVDITPQQIASQIKHNSATKATFKTN